MVTSLEIVLWHSHVTPSCNAGRHCPMVQLLHENCQQPTVDADGCLPSKSVYLVHAPEEDLFWALDYLHDRLKLWGEKRTLYKWRTFVAESLQKCVLVSRSFVCHLHFSGRDLPPSALDDNVASTRAVLTYLFTIMEAGRKDDMVQQVFQLLCRICNRVCETFCHDSPGYKMDLMLDDESRLEVCAQSGLVGGMQDFVSAKHRTAWQAWAKLWADMYSAGLLSVDVGHWKTSCTLLSQPPAFNGSSKAKLGIMNLLQVLLWFYFKGASSTFCPRACFFTSLASISASMMYTTKAVPSRQKGGSGKVAMSVDAIWDLLEHAGSTGVSAREALKVIGPGSRLSQAGGCHENSVDPWVRRRQIIYDQRATYSVSGANHYNLCADGSTHSGKDVLVSVIWCHQNNAAVLPAIQALLPCDAICPEELDLTSLVEELAKDLMT